MCFCKGPNHLLLSLFLICRSLSECSSNENSFCGPELLPNHPEVESPSSETHQDIDIIASYSISKDDGNSVNHEANCEAMILQHDDVNSDNN